MVILGVLQFICINSYGTIVVEPNNEGSPSTYCFVGYYRDQCHVCPGTEWTTKRVGLLVIIGQGIDGLIITIKALVHAVYDVSNINNQIMINTLMHAVHDRQNISGRHQGTLL